MRIDVVLATALGAGPLDDVRRARIVGAAPGLVLRIPEGAPNAIVTDADNLAALPGVLSEIFAAGEAGADAVVVNCTADTGVDLARQHLKIPVVGVSEAAFHLAAQLSRRFSVLTFDERIAPRFRAMARRFGMAERLASVRSVELALAEIDDFSRLARRLVRVAEAAVRSDGAELIVLGCTDFENAAAELRAALAETGLATPVIEPYRLAVAQAEMLVRLGLSHAPPRAPAPEFPRRGGDGDN